MAAATSEYIGEMTFQLAKMAKAGGLDALSYLLELASLEAASVCERQGTSTSDRRRKYSALSQAGPEWAHIHRECCGCRPKPM